MSKRVFTYARISGAHTQNELSIKEQQHQIRRYAMQHDMKIEREFSEVHSAFRTEGKKKLTARKVFYEMLASIDSGIDAILIFRYDRAIRLDKEFVILQDACTRYGVEIISITEAFGQEQGPISNFLVRNSVNLSQLYSEELSFKCKLGMRRAMTEGKLPWSRMPYGYIHIKKNVAEIAPSVAPFIREAFELYASGKYTFASVADSLASKWFKNRQGNPVDWRDIEVILGHEIYTGYKTMAWKLKKYEMTYYEWAAGPIFRERYRLNLEPIIEYRLYEAVSKIRQERSKYGPLKALRQKGNTFNKKVGSHLFSGAIQCHCGRHFVGQFNKARGIMYYGCSRSVTRRFTEKCHEPYIQEADLFIETRDFIDSLYLTPAKLRKLKEALDSLDATSQEDRERTVIENTAKIAEIAKKQTDLTERFIEGVVNQENYTLLNTRYRDEKILLKLMNEKLIKSPWANNSGEKIFAYFLWTNWLVERMKEHFSVRVSRNWRTKLNCPCGRTLF